MATFFLITAVWFLIAGILTHRRNAAEIRRGRQLFCRPGSETPIPILMPVYGRPHYLRRVLEALAGVDGIEKTILVVSQDGRNPEVSSLIAGIGFTDVIILKHTRPFLGIFCFFLDSAHAASTNIRFLLDFAFTNLDVECAIVLEDDIVPSPDFFGYFSWACRHILADKQVLSVTGFNLHSRRSPEYRFDPRVYPYDLVENREGGQPKFTGWSWAITASMWRRIRKHWSPLSWDIGLDKTQRKLGMISYKPVLGRVKNIGMQGGINFTEVEENPKWIDMTVAETNYSFVNPPRLLPVDPVLPPFRNLPPGQSVPNERERTRIRRLALCAIAAAMTVCEFYFLGWL